MFNKQKRGKMNKKKAPEEQENKINKNRPIVFDIFDFLSSEKKSM